MSKSKEIQSATSSPTSLTQVLSQRFTPETLAKDLDRLRTVSFRGRPFADTQLATVKLILELQGYRTNSPTVDARSVNLTLANLDPAQLTQMVNTLKELSARFQAITPKLYEPKPV